MNAKTCVVTGGSGFIGSHLIEELHKRGRRVINIDKVPPHTHMNDVIYECADLAKPDFKFLGERPDVLYHLAAVATVTVPPDKPWFESSREHYMNNAFGTYNAIKEINPEHIVFSSTANLYGTKQKRFEEFNAPEIISPYGYSKLIAELEILESTIPHTILRFGTVVGRRGRTFPNTLVWCAVHGEPIKIFNNGKATRSIIDVRDIVSAIIESPNFESVEKRIFNVATSQKVVIGNLVKLVEQIAKERGFKLNYEIVPWAASGYAKDSVLNIKKISRFGWEPIYSLESTIRDLFDYYEEPNAIPPPVWKEK